MDSVFTNEGTQSLIRMITFWATGAPLAFLVASYLIHKRKWKQHEGIIAFVFWPVVVGAMVVFGILWLLFKVFVGALWVLEMIFRYSARLFGEPVPPSELEKELKDTQRNPNRDFVDRMREEAERADREHALRMASLNEQIIKKKQELANRIKVNTKKDGSVH